MKEKENSTMSESRVVGNQDCPDFNRTEVFENTVYPKFEELRRMCMAYGIPMFAAFCPVSEDGVAYYKFDGVAPETIGREVPDEFFNKMLMIINGCDAVPRVAVEDEGIVVSNRAKTMMDYGRAHGITDPELDESDENDYDEEMEGDYQ